VNWKSELKLADLDASQRLEITCKRCGHLRYEKAVDILNLDGMRHVWLDEIEFALCCDRPRCKGGVRIAMVHSGKMEGFVGGMP